MNTSNAFSQASPAIKRMRQVMQNHPLFFFFLLSYMGSWIVSLPYVLSVWGVLSGDYRFGLMLKQWTGPALAAIIMTRVMEGKPGRYHLQQSIKHWRAGWKWYLFILLGIPVLILLGVIIQSGALAHFQGVPLKILVSYPVYFVTVFIGVGLPEEIGWRGFALPRMQARYGPLWGSMLLGVLWALWHLLYFLTPDHGGGPDANFAAFLANFSIFFLMVIALAIIFTWVFNHTKGSIFIASLMHSAIDTLQLVWLPLFLDVGMANSTTGESSLNLAILIVFGILALLILILTQGRLGYRPNLEQIFIREEPGTTISFLK